MEVSYKRFAKRQESLQAFVNDKTLIRYCIQDVVSLAQLHEKIVSSQGVLGHKGAETLDDEFVKCSLSDTTMKQYYLNG